MEDVARIYRTAKSIERRRIQVEIVRACRPFLAWLARGLAPDDAPDAEKVGVVGVLIALEKYDPARGAFWPFARPFVRDEIERWLSEPEGPDGDDGEPIPEDDAMWMRRAA